MGRTAKVGDDVPYVCESPIDTMYLGFETAKTLHEAMQRVTVNFTQRAKFSARIALRSPLGPAGDSVMIFRTGAGRLHVVGTGGLAEEVRTALRNGAFHGWTLHPIPAEPIHLHQLQPLLTTQQYRALERYGFTTVDELAGMPDRALLDVRHVGTKLLSALRNAIDQLQHDRASSTRPAKQPTDRGRQIEERLGVPAQLRYREFAQRLAASQLSAGALRVIADSLRAEALPPADPTVVHLLSDEADLLEYYLRTHAPAVDTAASTGDPT